MAKWKLYFVLLLPLTVFFLEEVTAETLEKTIGSKPDVTPLCTNSTTSIITLVACEIRRERSREECRLLYQLGHDFQHVTHLKCDSRFKLMMDNHSVFLHLKNLLPVDSGIYTCECVQTDGVYYLHLNITVEENKDASGSTHKPILFALIGVAVVIIIAGVFLKLIHRRKRHGDQQSATSGSSVCKTLKCLDPDDPNDSYINLQHTTSVIYQSVSTEAALIDHQEISR